MSHNKINLLLFARAVVIFIYLARIYCVGIFRRSHFQCGFHSCSRCGYQSRFGHVLLHAHLQIE